MLPGPPLRHPNSVTPADVVAQEARSKRGKRVTQLLSERKQKQPPRRYTYLTLAVALIALLDWMGLVLHATLDRHQPVDSGMATHIGVAATLAVCAAVLGVGWASMKDRAVRHADHDEIDEARQETWQEWLVYISDTTNGRELRAWADGIRDAGGCSAPVLRQASGGSLVDAPTVPLPAPTPIRGVGTNARPSNPRHRANSPRFGSGGPQSWQQG